MCTNADRKLLDSQLGKAVAIEVQGKLDASEPFTNACISHPLIALDPSVRHWDVKLVLAALWRENMFADSDGLRYLRTPITVYPDGASGSSARANLFYPDDGYDPYTFTAVDRILTRSDEADDDAAVDGTTITNTMSGSPVTKQCSVQEAESTLNVPRFLITAAGWNAGDNVGVDTSGGIVSMKRNHNGKQVIDREGRIRLHGTNATMFKGQSPVAVLVTPDAGDKYLQIAPGNAIAKTVAKTVVDDGDGVSTVASTSVWSK